MTELYLSPAQIEAVAIRCALGNNGGTWAEHYTEGQKEHWRQFVRDIAAEMVVASGFVIVPFNTIAALVQVHTRILNGIPIVEIGAKPDPFTNGVRDMHHYVESWLALRAIVHPEENGNGAHQGEAEGKDPVGT